MKISKKRLKEIIKEELSGLGESQETRGAPPNEDALRLADVATRVGGSEFAAAVSTAMIHAISTPESTGGPQAMGMMAAALKTLTLSRPESALEEAPQTPSSPNPLSRSSRDADNRERNRKREADPRRAGVEAAYEKNLEKAKEERRRRGIEQ